VIKLTLPYPPSTNRYWRVDRRGFAYVSTEAKKYKKQVGLMVAEKGLAALGGPVALYVIVYRPQKSGDLSNRLKIVEDVLQEIAYKNDSQVVELHMWRRDDKHNPRIEIMVRPVREGGQLDFNFEGVE
jgi:crossover junction endodeoxyribonuclease RusA